MPSGSLAPMLDAAFRGGAAALLLLLGALLLRQARRSPAALYGGLSLLSTIAYLINSWPAIFDRRPFWLLPVMLISMGTQALLFLFARACFDDEFRASWRDGLPWLGLVGLGFWCACSGRPLICYGFQAAQLAFVALIIHQALRGRSSDLIEGRRRFRLVLVSAAAGYSLLIIVLEMTLRGPAFVSPVSAGNAAGMLAFAFTLALAELSLAPRGGFVPLPAPRRTVPPEPADGGKQDAALLEKLRRLMEQEKVYREEGLAIASLAQRLAIPEYRLRRLINQRLGHRNFSSFVNGYRLADARAALADPAQAQVPVVTIALDAGFQSLGPFNRAFKAETGLTPTDYRRRELERVGKSGSPSPNSEIGKPIPA